MSGKIPIRSSLDLVSLAQELAAFLRRPTGRPFVSDVIIVDGKGTSNWLTHALVRDGGMLVQLNAQLLNSRRVGGWLASVIGTDALARKKGGAPEPVGHNATDHLSGLPTAIYDELADESLLQGEMAGWAKFRGEPARDGGAVLWELSKRIANHFRELLRNDPDWIEKVRRNAVVPDRWSVLWSRTEGRLRASLAERLGLAPADVMLHEVDVLRRLMADPAAVQAVCNALPGRIALFSTGDISTTLLRILNQLHGATEVRLFHLEPSPGYLKDIDRKRSAGAAILDASKRFFALQQDKLIDLLDKGAGEPPDGPSAASSGLLASLQASIADFDNAELCHDGFDPARDGSVSIHRCHGVWREAEALRDQLLKAFAEDPELKQGDVLILSPDPEAYAPVLEAVLGQRAIRPPGKDGGIRGFGFTTAGMYGLRRSPVGAMVDALLKLPKGRLTALDVFNFLSLEAVQSHHGWDESQLEEIEKWFRDAPYNWGLDMVHRAAVVRAGLNLEPTDAQPEMQDLGSLSDFLCRLALGTAFGEEIPSKSVAGQMPLRRVDGQQDMQLAAEVLRVLELLHAWVTFAVRTKADDSKMLALTEREMVLDKASPTAGYEQWDGQLGWLPAFKRVFNALRPQGAAYALECRALFKSLGGLSRRFDSASAAGRKVSYELFLALMEEHCTFESSAGQFMSGNVTLAPLRSTSIHPAKIIALMGMNDGAFPRRSGGLGPEVYAGAEEVFSRRAQECREDTSMHAFLLAVLAAQRRLLVTFDGYLGADGAAANAAYPIEMLRRCLRTLTSGKFKVTGHAIMAYLPVGLAKGDVPAQWTFDGESVAISKVLGRGVFPVLAPVVVPEPAKLSLVEWARFWESPPREVLRRLGVRVPYQGKVLRVEEPLQVDGPTEKLAADWVKSFTEQRRRTRPQAPTIDEVSPLARLSGMFPPGAACDQLLDFLLLQENHGKTQVIDLIKEFIATIDKSGDVELQEVAELSSELRGVFIHKGTQTMAVGVFERLYPDSEVIKWLCVLPKLAQAYGLKLTKLLVCGLNKIKKDEGKVVMSAGRKLSLEKKLCDLEGVDFTQVLARLEASMTSAASADKPVMPRTMWAGMSDVMEKSAKGKVAKSRATAADLLGGDEFSQSDFKDQRARVLIPEKFDFDGFNADIDMLLGLQPGQPSLWTYRGSSEINAILKQVTEAKKQTSEALRKQEQVKQREAMAALKKQEREAAAAARAAAKVVKRAEAEAQKASKKKSGVKHPRNPQGDSAETDPLS